MNPTGFFLFQAVNVTIHIATKKQPKVRVLNYLMCVEILDVDNHDNEQSSLPSLYADPYQTYTNDEEQTDGCGKKDKPSVKNKNCVLFLLVRDPGFHLFLFVTL